MDKDRPEQARSYKIAFGVLILTCMVWSPHQVSFDFIEEIFDINKTLNYIYIITMIFSFIAQIIGILLANYFMRHGQSMRRCCLIGSLCMIVTTVTDYWLVELIDYHDELNFGTITLWGTLGSMVGNFGEGMYLCAASSYVSLQCKALTSGKIFGIFFLSLADYEACYIFIDSWQLEGTFSLLIIVVVSGCLAACLWLLMPKEHSHHLEEEWYEEEVEWGETFRHTAWCIGFFACAEAFGWASSFLQASVPIGLDDAAQHEQNFALRTVSYTVTCSCYVAATILFGFGSDVHPKLMLRMVCVTTVFSYIFYLVAILTPQSYICELIANGLMPAAHCGWLVMIWSNLREHMRRNDHIATQTATWVAFCIGQLFAQFILQFVVSNWANILFLGLTTVANMVMVYNHDFRTLHNRIQEKYGQVE